MRATRFLAAAALLVAPLAAHAQVRGGDPMGGVPLPQDVRPLGVQMGMYHGSALALPAYVEGDQCGRIGCIIVINKSPGFDVTQFYVNDGKRDPAGTVDWGFNQFDGFALHSNRAVWTPRPNKMKCTISVRVVLRDKGSGEEVEGVEPFDMCALRGRGFAVLEIAYNRGKAEVGPPSEAKP